MKPKTEYLLIDNLIHATMPARYDTLDEYHQQFGEATSHVSTAKTFRDPIAPEFTILLLVESDDDEENDDGC